MWVLLFGLIVLVLIGVSKASALGSFASFLPGAGAELQPGNPLLAGFPVNSTGIQVYRSDSSLTGSAITNDPATWPGDDRLWEVCTAVAFAEGYNQGPGTAPYDLNNPGDIGPGDEAGEATLGQPQYHGGSYLIVFSVAEGGWRALRHKFNNIITGQSRVYSVNDSWITVSSKYAGNSVNWLSSVTGYLGVDPSSTPGQYVNG